MVIAFVLVNSKLGAEEKVRDALQVIEAVQEVSLMYGVYDIVTKVEVKSQEIPRPSS